MKAIKVILTILIVVIMLGALGYGVYARLQNTGLPPETGEARPVPVEVAPVSRGLIEQKRTFSGSLVAGSRMTVSTKVSGQIRAFGLELADPVENGQVIAQLDDDEHRQAVVQAQAEMAVNEAGMTEARSALEIADRDLERVRSLHERGIASDAQLDTVRADQLAKSAAVQVAEAMVSRAEAELESARIRLGYTTIRAQWQTGGDTRVVAERYVEEGDTVGANTPMLSLIELDPIEAVIYASERDYALLEHGQAVSLTTDAYPDRSWNGQVERVAPIFGESSRQARIEVTVPNSGGLLKPGLFVRVTAIFQRVEDALIVPEAAVAHRGGQDVVFVVDEDGEVARMVPVELGIREGDRIQLLGDAIAEIDGARVVTLGQQLLSEESRIKLPEGSVLAPDTDGDAGAERGVGAG